MKERKLKEKIGQNPENVRLNIKLIDKYLKKNKLDEALQHIVNVDTFRLHEIHGCNDWYQKVMLLVNKYAENNADTIDENWMYWMAIVMAKERSLYSKLMKTDWCSETTQMLYDFDQGMKKLESAFLFVTNAHDLEWAGEMVTHFRAQLCLIYAWIIIKRGKMIRLSWPLLCLAYSFGTIQNINQPKWIQSSSRKILEYIQNQSNVRLLHITSFSNEFLKKLWPNEMIILNVISSIVADQEWRKTVYSEVFSVTEFAGSHLIECSIFETPTNGWPSLDVLTAMIKPNDDISLKEISGRPKDVDLSIELINNLLKQENIQEAFNYVSITETQSHKEFIDSSDWYTATAAVLSEYKKINVTKINGNWLYWFQLNNSCERRLAFSPNNINLLFELDQYLFEVAKFTFSEGELASAFLPFFQGQMYMHAASVLINKNMRQTALPLLFLA